MLCANCGAFSFSIICSKCTKHLEFGEVGKRTFGDFCVYYFFKFDSISRLLYSKYHLHGLFVFNKLAKISFKIFAKNAKFNQTINAIPIDDNPINSYSHSAILAKALKSEFIKPKFGLLHAQNQIKYAGKSLKFRQTHPRKFKLNSPISNPVILVDDIVTTGTSMLEAKKVLEKHGVNVLFGLVLADARE